MPCPKCPLSAVRPSFEDSGDWLRPYDCSGWVLSLAFPHTQLYSSRVNASAKMMNVTSYGIGFEKIIHLLVEERRDLRPRKG